MSRFKGYAWTELADAWGIPDEYEDDDERAETVLIHMASASVSVTERDAMIADLREFVTALHRQSVKLDYWSPLWKGLLEIQESNTFIDACKLLLRAMWT